MGFLRIAFAWGGRIDRTTYLAMMALLFIFGTIYWVVAGMMAAAAPVLALLLTLLLLPVSAWNGLVLNVKRIRDMGRPPWLAFLPIGLFLITIFTTLPALIAAASVQDSRAIMSAVVSGGLLMLLSMAINVGMLLWMCFGSSDPEAPGEKLSIFSTDASVRSNSMSGFDADAALAAALARREADMRAQPAFVGAAPQPSLAGLPQRAAGPTIGPGGRPSFGRRR